MAFIFCLTGSASTQTDDLFRNALHAYRAANYTSAAIEFRDIATRRPATGALQNLGLAEWQCGRTGPAVLAWEQALWMDPFNGAARGNLQFVRKQGQLESPELAWYEVVSSWLPAMWWGWIASVSFWLALGMATVPGLLRRRKSAWHQAIAALGLMIFLLSLPAQAGLHTRSQIGFILEKDTPLRLTPTHEAQVITRLPSGTPVRLERTRGNFLLLRAGSQSLQGWIEKGQLGFLTLG
ncbi:MAG: hypothetical protein C5B50_19645 [Verrucomicrobia bacterium]|nr:MAG: hypothetical protein C5B50_19645 [Verrucomicrobiota bacterium]